jgi:hypothetical protein
MPEKVGFDDVIRHGSIVPVSAVELQRMKDLIIFQEGCPEFSGGTFLLIIYSN